ncbi:excinuclease ABC subunit UvrC [Candidatus Chloroploca asiatica]|uniref:UvrABC system protein C n=1 Tax=Candidatus Chloroploca asiatica TaxID=1506545 RepID=A0A2H3KJH2_9CHLR|nr:excinuclease ABC subunit UvrC [Candidatus Chloroploca asiatica]PDV98052.1 excinuclease ABC subunit C [Candidatus Chloroploca asiatica]
MPDFSSTAIADPVAFDERLRLVPDTPGVYLWKDAQGQLIYVGKSKRLRDRMRSYFGAPRGLSAKTRRMVSHIADFEIIVTQSELEALLLEMNLIKQHRPRYNILLKDDKSYPYIKVTLQDTWPRVFSTRRVADDGARYFGPYASAGSVRKTLDLLNRLFAFRPSFECKDDKFKHYRKLGRPCLYHQMKRCLGPCVPGLVTEAEYRATIEAVCRFLEGKTDQVVRDLRRQMEQASDALEFERAAYVRDRLQAIEKISERQQVLRTVDEDQDVIAFAREDGSAVVQVLFIRGGKLVNAEPFTLQGTDDETDADLLASFITQFYDHAPNVPPTLLLADHIEEPMIIASWLEQKAGHRVELSVPRRGEKKQLIELAATNAHQKLEEVRQQWLNSEQRAVAGLSALRDLLDLAALPQRIECYDISNTQGQHSVASMVVFERGEPRPSAYRRFKIKTVVGANDVASLHEVLVRRFKRAAEALSSEESATTDEVQLVQADLFGGARTGAGDPDDAADSVASPGASDAERDEALAKWADLPDLLLVDGGRGQVNAALDALKGLGFDRIPLAGVAKGPDRNRFDLVLPHQPEVIVLERNSPVLGLVQRIDEEAHRFAITYHRKVRSKASLSSSLDTIPGIGPKRKKALIKAFGSLDGIRKASVEELAAVPGMNRKAAEELKGML